MFPKASLQLRIAAAGVTLLLLQSCNLFVPKPSDDSKQNSSAAHSAISGDRI